MSKAKLGYPDLSCSHAFGVVAQPGVHCEFEAHFAYMARPAIDPSQLTPDEKLDLIGELWDSLDDNDITYR